MFVFSLGLILSPRKYASADQIHALFTQVPARPHSSYSKSKKCPSSSDEKGQYVEDLNASNNKYGTLKEIFFKILNIHFSVIKPLINANIASDS